MGITIVVGGQWGSEGKGKVAHWYAKANNIQYVVRVGGSNSGHTVIDSKNNRHIFRMLPTSAIEKNVVCVLPAGTYIDLDILKQEISNSGIQNKHLKIHPNAVIITDEFKNLEINNNLSKSIGSTGSGTGAAVIARINRNKGIQFAKDVSFLNQYICDTTELLREVLDKDQNVLVEGTQGYGLSVLHSNTYPFVTSRDTTAAGFLSETGLSPLDVSNIIMVIRSYPIRVGGNSGPLPNEITWSDVTKKSGGQRELLEFTSVTNKVRRVAMFDSEIVKKAIAVNKPTIIVLNHCDYFDAACYDSKNISATLKSYIFAIQKQIGKIDYIGTSERHILKNGL
ncbi:MAG: adenylosuccinate synthetase [Endomicrobiaceae bacterium]